MAEMGREQVLSWLRQEKSKAVFVENFKHLDKNLSFVTESLIYFKPRVFGKASTKAFVKILGLKTKEDCERLNQELYP
jgi:N-dimethylarginine dimethylaminohydrolase